MSNYYEIFFKIIKEHLEVNIDIEMYSVSLEHFQVYQ